MRKYFFLFCFLPYFYGYSQDYAASKYSGSSSNRASTDSLVLAIDSGEGLRVQRDSILKLDPTDPYKLIGVLYYLFLTDADNQLKKSVENEGGNYFNSYYFNENDLVFVHTQDLKNGKSYRYYYSPFENKMSKSEVEKALVKNPALKDYFKQLKEGISASTSFSEYFIHRRK
ncbi:MAG: hypothetical protein H0U44_12130 [Flavisolibacter sp.]|jgi:hypothetical protein|nr:hypothetical protein [Flavisolibacter sp.]